MSSKAAKRKAEYEKRQEKRRSERERTSRIRNANGLKEMAAALGIKLK